MNAESRPSGPAPARPRLAAIHPAPAPARGPGSGPAPAPVLPLVLALLFCLVGEAAYALSPAPPLCLDGRLLLIPGPENSQIAAIFASLDQSFALPAIGAVEMRFTPGRGGSYALRDLGREKADGCRQAGLVLPSLFYLERGPESMILGEEISVTAVSACADNALWVAKDGPRRNWQEFLAHARSLAADPVAYVAIAGTGSYTDQHMATLQLNRAAGIRAEYSPLLGSAQAAGAVSAGRADACWGYALEESGMPGMIPLAVAAEKRSPALPGVPTFRELGVEFVNTACFAFAVPAATPPERQEALRAYRMISDKSTPPLAPGLRPAGFAPPQLPVFLESAATQAGYDMDAYPLLPDAPTRLPGR